MDERLARRGFYEDRDLYQEKMGGARFFTTEDIEQLNPFRVTDVLRDVTDFRVVHLGGGNLISGGSAAATYPSISMEF